nr:hypothetical protein [Tanacetum cinerariifolium]
KDAQVKGRQVDTQAEIYNIDLDHTSKVVAASIPIPAAKPAVVAVSTPISAAKPKELSSDTPTETPKVKDKGKGILIEAPKPMKKKGQIELDAKYARKLQEAINKEHEETYKNIDSNAALDHVQSKEPQYIKRYHGMKKKPQTESEARKNMIFYLKNSEGYKMDFFKGMKYDEIPPIFQAKFDANMRFLFKSREAMEEEDKEIIKSINEKPAQKAAKRRKMHEQAKEDEDLKKQLEVVIDEDDDVFIEATPIGRKAPVVDYEIVMINNKPRYKIIKADGNHQLYISFITMLKNFNREDLEDLWRIVKARFSTSKPTNFFDDYLLSTLKTMFEKTDGQDSIWRNQQIEKRYPLSKFTLEQLVNVVRLKVEEESEMSLELVDTASLRLKLFKDVVAVADAKDISTETSDGLAAIQAQLNNLGKEIKKEGSYGPQFLEAYSEASHMDNSIPQEEKDPGSFTLSCFINNVCFDNGLVDLGSSISVMPLSTFLNLGLGELAHTMLTVELADKTVKYPKGIAENVLVEIGKFTFPIDFIILDMPEDIKVPLILRRPFLSTARAKINIYKREIILKVRKERIIFKSVKHASSLIKGVYMLSLRERMEFDLEARLMGETLVINRSLDPLDGDYIELNDLNEPFELRRNQGDNLMPTIKEVLENMDAYRDEGMGNVIFGEPFLREVGIKTRRSEGMITIYNEQYFLMTDYSLWEIIKNGNKVLTKPVGSSEQTYEPTTAEEKQDRRNEMKARGTLLMALLKKDQVKFHSYQDAKLLMEAIEKRYEGNKESKKGEVIQQEDMNLKLLRNLPSEWKTHALIWRNKTELETISLDDLYKNLKIYEPKISGSSNTNQNLQNMAFVSSKSTSNTNEADTTASGVSTAHTQGTTVNSTSVDNLSDAMICAFLASQTNTPQLSKEDLEQINPDNLEEMDIHWEIATLTIRARRFMKKIGRSLDMNGRRISFDKTKSYQAKEETPTNYAFMALTSSGSSFSSDSEEGMIRAIKLRKRLLQTMHSWLLHLHEVLLVLILSFVNLSELLEKQNNRSTKGYHEVPTPLTGNYMPSKRDLKLIDEHFESESVDVSTVLSSADKTVKTVDITYKGVLSTEEPKSVMKNNFGPPIIKDWHSNDDGEDKLSPTIEVKNVKHSVENMESVKAPKETVKTAESHKPHKHYPRGNKRN